MPEQPTDTPVQAPAPSFDMNDALEKLLSKLSLVVEEKVASSFEQLQAQQAAKREQDEKASLIQQFPENLRSVYEKLPVSDIQTILSTTFSAPPSQPVVNRAIHSTPAIQPQTQQESANSAYEEWVAHLNSSAKKDTSFHQKSDTLYARWLESNHAKTPDRTLQNLFSYF